MLFDWKVVFIKVLMVTPYYYPTVIGGAERVIENFSKELNKIGVTTDILTSNFDPLKPCSSWRKEAEEIYGSRIIRVPVLYPLPRWLHQDDFMLKVNFIPRKFKAIMKDYDIIHYHNDVDLSFPFFSKSVDKPKIFHLHCLNLTYNFFKKNFMAKYVLKNISNRYIVVSNLSARMLVDLGICEKAIRVVPNGIDTDKFLPQRGIKTQNLLLFAGRIDPAKGLTILFRALNFLNSPVRLLIVGPAKDSLYYKKVMTLAKKVNEKEVHMVEFIGMQNPYEMTRLYQEASIFVLPSLSESLPMSILEALACETPVVASDVGSISDVVQNYKNGILVPSGDPVMLAKAIEYLLDNEIIRKKFGEEGRRFVIKLFSSKAAAENLRQIYKEMIS
jgi:glycosyltransferase involved in cell wall biosynthesis